MTTCHFRWQAPSAGHPKPVIGTVSTTAATSTRYSRACAYSPIGNIIPTSDRGSYTYGADLTILEPTLYKRYRDEIYPYTSYDTFIDYLIDIGRLPPKLYNIL